MKDLLGDEPVGMETTPEKNARRSDTSLAAKRSIERKLTELHERILRFMVPLGDAGASYDDVMVACSMTAPTATGRLNELSKSGHIRDSGRRAVLRSKRRGRVYVVTDKGVAAYNDMARDRS